MQNGLHSGTQTEHAQTTTEPAYSPPASTNEVSREWDRLEQELAEWGSRLDELQQKAELVGEDVVDDLQRRYRSVKSEAEMLKQHTERELREAQEEAAKLKAKADRQSQERKEKLKQSAQDLGQGLSRAWTELRTGVQQAYRRFR